VYVGRALLVYGEYGEREWQLLAQLCRPGAHVVEVGANIGSLTVPLARAVGPRGRVVALEPQPVVFWNLCANLVLNELTQVEPIPVGCAEAAGRMKLPAIDYGRDGNFGGVSLKDAEAPGGGCDVEVRRLDELIGPRRVDLIKVDVEGMEERVLIGAEGILERDRPSLYLENDRVDRSPALITRLEQLGYRLWWSLPPLYNPANFRGNPADLYPRVVSVNMLAVHESRPAEVSGLAPVVGPEDHPLRRRVPARSRRAPVEAP
jgi:FkbM family methyltransferase